MDHLHLDLALEPYRTLVCEHGPDAIDPDDELWPPSHVLALAETARVAAHSERGGVAITTLPPTGVSPLHAAWYMAATIFHETNGIPLLCPADPDADDCVARVEVGLRDWPDPVTLDRQVLQCLTESDPRTVLIVYGQRAPILNLDAGVRTLTTLLGLTAHPALLIACSNSQHLTGLRAAIPRLRDCF